MREILVEMKSRLKINFVSATLNFMFIIIFVNVFQIIFGNENSIVGVIFAIMMSASMVRDMTAEPLKHLFIQAVVLVWMGISACMVSILPPVAAFPVNLLTVFLILYVFTYEYSNHMYFPYILSYLFLVFISPVSLEGLPKRLLGLLTGAVCIILYQMFKGRNRVVETARDVFTLMIDEAKCTVEFLLTGKGAPADPEEVRHTLCRLSKTVYDRRKKVLCVSDAGFSMIDSGRGMEHIIILLHEMERDLTPARREMLGRTVEWLDKYRAYVHSQTDYIDEPDKEAFIQDKTDAVELDFYNALLYVRAHLLHMTNPEKRKKYRKTMLSWSVRMKAALDISPVRVIYALRVSVLLSVFTLFVQLLELSHGKWLLFTLASLSLPYADDVGLKTRKRIAATIIGGLVSLAAYALIPSVAGRTAVMMFSGYISFYFKDYVGTYACSTIGALGGAVIMDTFGWAAVGHIFLIRIIYICAGAVIALAANCLLFPYKRRTATRQLLRKYAAVTELLNRVCREEDADVQLYYSLVIQAHLMEEKLSQNALSAGWDEMGELLAKCRKRVRRAHRQRTIRVIW